MTRGRRIMAARHLRALATIEKLSALGNDSEVRRLLAGIDPLDCHELAAELDAENAERTLAQVIPLGNVQAIDACIAETVARSLTGHSVKV